MSGYRGRGTVKPDDANLLSEGAFARALSGQTMLVHRACKSQLVRVEGKAPFCEVCDRSVGPGEVEEVDNSPGPFSG